MNANDKFKLIGIYDGNSFFDSFIIDGYEDLQNLIEILKRKFNTSTEVLDIINYLDSDGNGTRCVHSLTMNPNDDFNTSEMQPFECNNANTFMNLAQTVYGNALVWKYDKWWEYDVNNNVCRRIS